MAPWISLDGNWFEPSGYPPVTWRLIAPRYVDGSSSLSKHGPEGVAGQGAGASPIDHIVADEERASLTVAEMSPYDDATVPPESAVTLQMRPPLDPQPLPARAWPWSQLDPAKP